MKEELKKCKKYMHDNMKYIIVLILILVCTYFVKIFNYSISIDTENTVNNINGEDGVNLVNGRWAILILSEIINFDNKFNPFFNTILTLIFFVLSVIVLSYLISKIMNKPKTNKIALMVLGGSNAY